jgi:acid stress chaperone HdeB
MNGLFATTIAAVTLLSVGLSSAEVIDLTAWTCTQFVNADKDTTGIVLAWVDGYYHDENTPPVIDKDRLAGNAKKIGDYCAANPDVKLITATDRIFGSD